MLPKRQRFTQKGFPGAKPFFRTSLPWGSISLYKSDIFKAAVVVSKKVTKSAPERNRIRRRLYAALRNFSDKKVSIVVYPRKDAETTPLTTIVNDLTEAL